jgi:hypothetical protein
LKASEVSKEMVALYLLASLAQNEEEAVVGIINGIPLISGMSKEWILTNYVDCLRTVFNRKVQ